MKQNSIFGFQFLYIRQLNIAKIVYQYVATHLHHHFSFEVYNSNIHEQKLYLFFTFPFLKFEIPFEDTNQERKDFVCSTIVDIHEYNFHEYFLV